MANLTETFEAHPIIADLQHRGFALEAGVRHNAGSKYPSWDIYMTADLIDTQSDAPCNTGRGAILASIWDGPHPVWSSDKGKMLITPGTVFLRYELFDANRRLVSVSEMDDNFFGNICEEAMTEQVDGITEVHGFLYLKRLEEVRGDA